MAPLLQHMFTSVCHESYLVPHKLLRELKKGKHFTLLWQSELTDRVSCASAVSASCMIRYWKLHICGVTIYIVSIEKCIQKRASTTENVHRFYFGETAISILTYRHCQKNELWVWNTGGIMLTGDNRTTHRQTQPSATLHTTAQSRTLHWKEEHLLELYIDIALQDCWDYLPDRTLNQSIISVIIRLILIERTEIQT